MIYPIKKISRTFNKRPYQKSSVFQGCENAFLNFKYFLGTVKHITVKILEIKGVLIWETFRPGLTGTHQKPELRQPLPRFSNC